jgi:hypothetical protein
MPLQETCESTVGLPAKAKSIRPVIATISTRIIGDFLYVDKLGAGESVNKKNIFSSELVIELIKTI